MLPATNQYPSRRRRMQPEQVVKDLGKDEGVDKEEEWRLKGEFLQQERSHRWSRRANLSVQVASGAYAGCQLR